MTSIVVHCANCIMALVILTMAFVYYNKVFLACRFMMIRKVK